MQKQLFHMLATGGMAMLCFAPQHLSAEDSTSELQKVAKARVFSNVNELEPVKPSIPSAKPAIPETKVTPPSNAAADQPSISYRSLIEVISRNNGVDPDLIDAMMRTESNYNRWAVSSKGARGLMQLIPETGHRFGVQDFFDPQQNIEGAVRYIRFLLDMFHGNVDLTLAAYNAGENLVARLGKVPPIPETRNYVRKIRAVYTKPTSRTFAPSVNLAPIKVSSPEAPAAAGPVTNEALTSTKLPDKIDQIKEAPRPSISKRVDERGVTHYSNIELSN